MDELAAKFASLDIRLFDGEDGKLTVVSESEPCFCFVRSTEKEIEDVVEATLRSYARRFYNKEVQIKPEFTHAPSVPRVSLQPRGAVRTKVNYFDDRLVPA